MIRNRRSGAGRRNKKSGLAELIANHVSGQIAAGRFNPGDLLPSESELAAEFEVARTVVREAIVSLRALGIVDVYQGKGAFVAELPMDLLLLRIRRFANRGERDLKHIWEIREILETAIAEMAAQRRTGEDISRMRESIAEMQRVVSSGGSGEEEDEAFHRYLTKATHNPVLEEVMADIASLMRPSRVESLGMSERPRQSADEHQQILNAVEAEDQQGAREAMLLHLAGGRKLTAGE